MIINQIGKLQMSAKQEVFTKREEPNIQRMISFVQNIKTCLKRCCILLQRRVKI
jgi:hypothetical protein